MEAGILGHFCVSRMLIQMVPFFSLIVLPSEVRLELISYHKIMFYGKRRELYPTFFQQQKLHLSE